MASVKKICRVCGREYEACRSANRTAGVFRWQEVACSPECGMVYLEQIKESRNHTAQKHTKTKYRPAQTTVGMEAQTASDGALCNTVESEIK